MADSTELQKATTTRTTSLTKQLALVETKAQAIERFGGMKTMEPIPADKDRKNLYLLFMKIGATGELPSRKELKDAMLNDFWLDLYWKNPIVPAQIPFAVIIREFKTYAVQNSHERKGNNQGEITRQFNNWIRRPKVLEDLVHLRNELFPELKPKELQASTEEKPIQKWQDSELTEALEKARKQKEQFPIPFMDRWITKLETEIEQRKS